MVNVGEIIEKNGKRYTVESVNWMGQPVKLKEELLQKSDAVDSDQVEDIQDNTEKVKQNQVLGIFQFQIKTLGVMDGSSQVGKITYGETAVNQRISGSVVNMSSSEVTVRFDSLLFDGGFADIELQAANTIGSRIQLMNMPVTKIYCPNTDSQLSTSPDVMVVYTLIEQATPCQQIGIKLY